MFKTSMALKEAEKELVVLKKANKQLEADLKGEVEGRRKDEIEASNKEKEYDLKNQQAVNDLREEMRKDLVKSDILRAEAVAKLEIYEKTDTKADANAIKDMIAKLITALGTKGEITVVK